MTALSRTARITHSYPATGDREVPVASILAAAISAVAGPLGLATSLDSNTILATPVL